MRYLRHSSNDPMELIDHLQEFLARAFRGSVPKTLDPRLNTLTRASGSSAGGSGSGGGGGGASVLFGDVTGPPVGNTVSALQGVTLTLTSPVTGQLLVFTGTAWVNTNDIPGSLTVDQVLKTAGFVTAVVAKNGPYTLLYTDAFVEADATGGPFTLTLPTAVGHAGQVYSVKKIDATVNAVTVATTGGQTIDGGATAVLAMPQTSLDLRADGSNWSVT